MLSFMVLPTLSESGPYVVIDAPLDTGLVVFEDEVEDLLAALEVALAFKLLLAELLELALLFA